VDTAFLQLFKQNKAEGALVSGPMCAKEAKIFHKAVGLEGEFTASLDSQPD
jgi:hypothetical protein